MESGMLEAFLKRTSLTESERSDVMEAVAESDSSRTQWVMAGGGKVYSVVMFPVRKDDNSRVQLRLEEAARRQASARAHYLLYLRAVPTARKARYANEESVSEALAGWDANREEAVRLKPNLSVAIVSDGWAFSLLRTDGELMNALSAQIQNLSESELDTAYCASLYPKAKKLFDQSEYEKALPVYRELHALKWAKPDAYLDAAECFLHTGDKNGAATLTAETVAELEGNMNDEMLQRAGDILLESGDEQSAERLYRLAIQKLRQDG